MAQSIILALGQLCAIFLLLIFLRAIYRLTLHPLARFPGPFWAKVSSIYGMTYDFSPSNEGYVKALPKLHDQYGPIVRFHPNELHIRDIDAYYSIFRAATPFDKDRTFYSNPSTDGFFQVHNSREAKPWKDVYQPYFSKAAIGRLEPLIHARLKQFLSKLNAAAQQDEVVDLSLGLRCFSSDVVMSYCFADEGFQTIEAEGFRHPTLVAFEEFLSKIQFQIYLPNFMGWVAVQLDKLPQNMQQKFVPALAAMNWISEQCRVKLIRILEDGGSNSDMPTVFDAWASSKKDRSWTPTLKQLTCDAFTFHAAGGDTTAHTLTVGIWYIMANSNIKSRLVEELKKAIPDADNAELVSSSTLENLPYLKAIVKESLRLSYGPPGRLPRTTPKTGAVLCGQQIPAGITVASSAYCFNTWDKHFEDPMSFKPDRWLVPEAAELERYMVSFSRGSRSCLGINLAYAELYLMFAYLFRKFELTPYNTASADIEHWKDSFLPVTRKHLEVKLKLRDR